MLKEKDFKFEGFQVPHSNYSKLPHALIDNLPEFSSLAELKVILYLIRHTWGFSEYGKPKKLTTDEFINGRKLRSGARYDQGTGLSADSVIDGLRRAVEHGFLSVITDDADKARIKKYYCLNMFQSPDEDRFIDNDLAIDNLDSQQDNLDSYSLKSLYRSEKETVSKKLNSKKASSGKKLSKEDQAGIVNHIVKTGERFIEAYKHQIIFTSSPEMLALADLCVQYFGKPTKTEAYKIQATCKNWLDNDVIPADVEKAKEVTDTWGDRKPNSPHNAFSDKVKALARDRFLRKNIGNDQSLPIFPKIGADGKAR